MAARYATHAGSTNAAGTSGSCSKPASVANGDWLVAFVALDATQATVSSTGWTHRLSSGGFQHVLTKEITNAAGEPASYTFSWSGSTRNDICIVRVRSTSGLLLAWDEAAGAAGLTAPSVTADQADECLLVAGTNGNARTVTIWGNSVVERYDPGGQSNGPSLGVGSKDLTASGGTGTTAITWSGSGANEQSQSVLLKELAPTRRVQNRPRPQAAPAASLARRF